MSSSGVFILQTDHGDDAGERKPRPSASTAEQPLDALPRDEGTAFAGFSQVPTNFASLAGPPAGHPPASASLPTRLNQLSVARDTPLPLTLTPFARALLRR
jgi:hypothetical protein